MPLVKYLNKQYPCYAIQDPRITDSELTFTSLEELVSLYIKEIKTVQSEGPYLLGGHSYGGVVAFEMARQLRENGEEVKFIVLIDSWAVFSDYFRDEALLEKITRQQEETLISQLPADISISKETWISLYQSRVNLLYGYKPPKTDMKLTLFKAEDVMPDWQSFQHDKNYWDRYTNLDVDSHIISGDHDTLLQEPNVQVLAQKINEYLDKIENC